MLVLLRESYRKVPYDFRMVAAIILHIKEKITKEPFKKLILSFFGGEPLLQKILFFVNRKHL